MISRIYLGKSCSEKHKYKHNKRVIMIYYVNIMHLCCIIGRSI